MLFSSQKKYLFRKVFYSNNFSLKNGVICIAIHLGFFACFIIYQ
jgi:hypothetical protein